MMILVGLAIALFLIVLGNVLIERGKPKDPTPLLGVVQPKEKKK